MKTIPGITFSHPHLSRLGLDPDQALQTALEFNFSYIRLGSYWNELEPKPGQYNFDCLFNLLERCQAAAQPVVLTVGVKAPRWPEFYWPDRLSAKSTANQTTQQQILEFTKQVVSSCQRFSCITHWQVENEPLDPSGPNNLSIPLVFLKKQIELVRQIDTRPVVINLWGNDLLVRGLFNQVEPLADIIGLDLYPKQFLTQFFGKSFYRGPSQTAKQLKELLIKSSRPIWITELQAEPWEKDETAYLSANPGSISPELVKKNFKWATQLPVEEIFLWGFEYWLWQAEQGNKDYLRVVKKLVGNKK
ncbi:MAG: hypothetical protein GF381_01520 [Candidatus Pacebacteria bacterium]|nr:hypothetical protein [Candidatus Paceibacterota bacterium]